jgi:predicted permease
MEGLSDYAALRVTPLSEARVNGQSRVAVGVLMAAAAMVLLIACANLAGLLLARGRSQSRAAAIRLALGAGRARVARSALAESLVLAAVGGGLGLLMARWGIQALRSAWPARFLTPEGATIRSVDLALLRLDAGAIGFAVLATLLTVLVFGLVPALRTARVAPQETLCAGGTITRGRAGRRWPAASILVATQMALALVLLVGAGLMFDSLLRLRSVPVGFDTSRMLVMDVTVSRNSPAFEQPVPLREALVARIAALPGVDAATLGCAPLYGLCWTGGVTGLDGRAVETDATVGIHMVPDGFFETLRIPVIAGRTFGPSDRDGGPPVVVINQRAAQRVFGEENPIGRTMKVTADITEEQQAEVIGIVGDVLQGRPDQGPQPEAYFTERQMAEAGGALMIRTRGEPLDAVSAIRAAARDVDPTIVVDRARTMNDMRARALGDTRVLLVLLGLFAFVAVALAGAGLWAIVALSVADRRRELGLRVVLGARSSELIAMVTRQGFGAALAGAFVGGWAAWGLSRLLSSLLFETNAHEPVAFVGAAIVLLAGALLASVIPARRATRVDPARTLRAD